MSPIIPILNFLNHPILWRFTGFISSIIGLLCYALSSSFKHLFGEWNLLKIFLYVTLSFITCIIVLLAKKWQLSKSLILKAHVGFLILMLTSVYSFFYDKSVNGKSDVLGLISCVAFALMSLSLSRQIDLGFEVDLLNFFLGCVTVQLMNFNLMLASIGGVFCYFVIVLRASLESQQRIKDVGATVSDHVEIEIEGVEIRGEHRSNSEYKNQHQELPSLRKRHFVTSAPEEVHPRNSLAAYVEFVDAAKRIRAAYREHTEEEIKEFNFFNQEAEARKRVAAIMIQHAFHNYKARKMTQAATRIQRTFRARKLRKIYLSANSLTRYSIRS
ncbi:uncharacterized protein [Cicer arietinum]|uniref:Uncharacterized protein LOC101500062 n=1 Tax=Cicer arietinum TaxID=3827 RepID=A0A1S2XKC1_CICAR|nr:uncharacterized protein LOC101500062 [Cicer arietinum]